MAKYNTEQKKILLDFLMQNSESSYTIEEITEALARHGEGVAPARSTVYRLMNSLVEDKKVHRTAAKSGRSFLYRCTPHDECRHHLHLQCTECGRIFHLDRDTSEGLLAGVRAAKSFEVSEAQTVLFGRCTQCIPALGGEK